MRNDDLEFATELWWFVKGVAAFLLSAVGMGIVIYVLTGAT